MVTAISASLPMESKSLVWSWMVHMLELQTRNYRQLMLQSAFTVSRVVLWTDKLAVDRNIRLKKSLFFIIFWISSQNFDQIIAMWHLVYGDTPLGIYLLKNNHMLRSYLLDFQVCNTAASVWWTCPYNNNLMKHFKWKIRNCNVMKKKTISSIKYICYNKQLKNLHKFMPMNINQQITTLNIQKTPDSDIF